MMKRYIIFVFLVLCACNPIAEQVQKGREVTVNLALVVSDDLTKSETSTDLSASCIEDVVKNFWIAQYDGVTDDAKLVGEAKYIPDMDVFMKPSDQGGNDEQVKLVASNEENLVIIIANTFDSAMSFPQGSTLSDLKKKLRIVSDEESFLSSDEDYKYLVLSGKASGIIREGSSFVCDLERNVAKVSIRILNSSDELKINSWHLRSVPSVSYYFTNYDLPEIYPAVGDFTGIDYPLITAAHPLENGDEAEYIAYLPVNKWGERLEVTNEAYKNRYAPKGATYLEINAVAVNGNQPLVYRFYMGENMTTDFNVLPNTSYSFTFDINSVGDTEYDSRVGSVSIVDFANHNDEPANCYVLNPAEVNGVLKRFRIPVKRVDEFWGGRGYEDVPANTLGTDQDWVVELIACNFDNSDIIITKSEGKGAYDPSVDELQYFEVEVSPGTVGNAIVALRKKGSGNPILWSWHLWITDYAPDQAYGNVPSEGVYAYSVDGGVVHRYEGSLWHGEYAKRFIMDRNLGSPSASHLNAGNGSLYYQFGRKDPLFGHNSTDAAKFTSIDYNSVYDPSDPVSTVVYSIANPLVLIDHRDSYSRRAWTEGNKYNPEVFDGSIVWQDPYTSTRTYPSTTVNKSIFDPCPPGYCIPRSGTWDDFRRNDSEKPTTNVTEQTVLNRGFRSFESVNGCLYWPYPLSGNDDALPSEVVYYPLTGYKEGSVVSSQSMYLYSLSSTPLDYLSAIGMNVSYTPSVMNLTGNYSLGRNLALPIRCITSRDVE